jgi:hypothetical protein
MALVAKLATYHDLDDRREARSRLWLDVPSDLDGAAVATVVIHDLSRSGLLVQVDADLAVGSEISVEIPEAGAVPAKIVWAGGSFFGCQFHAPISEVALSAALSESRVVYPDFPLPTERPPFVFERAEAPIPEAALPEPDIERGAGLSPSARILAVIGISLLLWTAIAWIAISLF